MPRTWQLPRAGIAVPDGCSCTDPAPSPALGTGICPSAGAAAGGALLREGNPNPQTLGAGNRIPKSACFPFILLNTGISVRAGSCILPGHGAVAGAWERRQSRGMGWFCGAAELSLAGNTGIVPGLGSGHLRAAEILVVAPARCPESNSWQSHVQEHPWPSIPSPSRPWSGFGKPPGASTWLVPPGAAWAEHLLVAPFNSRHTKGNPIGLWLVFSFAGGIQDAFGPVFAAEGN